jgi:hypothetical protein
MGSSWPLVWPFGCIADLQGGVCRCLLPEYMRMKKKPVNIGLRCLLSSNRVAVLPEIVWRGVATLAEAPAAVARATQD